MKIKILADLERDKVKGDWGRVNTISDLNMSYEDLEVLVWQIRKSLSDLLKCKKEVNK